MNIKDKDRKQLWAKSGNQCAICKKELFHANEDGKDFNIGEECHIISKKPDGPRHIPNMNNYDTYDNLILLCCEHHKEIDDKNNVAFYTIERLHQIKEEHEKWVSETLGQKNSRKNVDDKEIFRKLDLVNFHG